MTWQVRSYEKMFLCNNGQAKKKKNHTMVIVGSGCVQRTFIFCKRVKNGFFLQKNSVVLFCSSPSGYFWVTRDVCHVAWP